MANFDWLRSWTGHTRSNGHSNFDLSKRMAFHLPNGLITPIRFIETTPDEHYNINMSGIMRTFTMNKAAFFSGKAVFSAFFVPYKQLWHNFNQFVVMKQDKHSVQYRNSVQTPVCELSELVKFVALSYYHEIKDIHGYLFALGAARLLQFAKIYNIFPLFSALDSSAPDSETAARKIIDDFVTALEGRYVNMWRILAYQHIFYDYYRNKYYHDYPLYQPSGDGDPNVEFIDTFNVDDIDCSDLATSLISIGNNDFDPTNNTYEYYNDCRLANMLTLHYCQYRKDLYTSLLPSTQFGAVSGIDFSVSADLSDVDIVGTDNIVTTGNDLTRWRMGSTSSGLPDALPVSSNSNNHLQLNNGQFVRHTHTVIPSGIANELSLDGTLNLPSGFDVLQLRKAELLQQWKQNALRAGNMVDSNFESHYGVKPYYEDDNNVRFLGSFECNLDVNPVTATADSDSTVNGSVGDLAAYGVGSINGNTIDCQIKDFGVIVICAAFHSEVYYSANGIDKQNTLIEPFDYFQSEFENAGLDTVSAWQQSTGMVTDDAIDRVLGYTPPYTMYKTEVDEVFGEYSEMYIDNPHTQTIQDWRGSLSAWTARRDDFISPDGGHVTVDPQLRISRFYQSPSVTDSIFGVTSDLHGDTDPFGFAVNIQCTAIRPMSVLGIPIFG